MSLPLSNDNLELTPQTTFDGPALAFDFADLEIGVAEYDQGPTGCTVFSEAWQRGIAPARAAGA